MAFGHVPWIAGIFYGLKPAVTAIVLFAMALGSQAMATELSSFLSLGY
jgi:chromate transporter